MLMRELRRRFLVRKEPETIHLDEDDLECEVTDEIEMALWDLKESLDLPTEEVVIAVESRKKLRHNK